MKPPSIPQILLIFLEITILSALIHFERIGAIGGVEYGVGLLGIVILFSYLIKLVKGGRPA